MRIDFNACATFKGENQKPLWTERLFRFGMGRPSITEIAETAISRGLDAVVLRSHSHPKGTDNRWQAYVEQMKKSDKFKVLGNGIAIYNSDDPGADSVILIHGQGLETDKGNIEVLFADGNVGGRGDLYRRDLGYLVDAARDAGERPLIIALKPYLWNGRDFDRVDALEIWNGLDTKENNADAEEIAKRIEKPGVISSGSKCLFDLGRSYSSLPSPPYRLCTESITSSIYSGLFSGGYMDSPSGQRGTNMLSRLIQMSAVAEVKLTANRD